MKTNYRVKVVANWQKFLEGRVGVKTTNDTEYYALMKELQRLAILWAAGQRATEYKTSYRRFKITSAKRILVCLHSDPLNTIKYSELCSSR